VGAQTLVIGGSVDGGLFVLDGDRLQRLDELNTMGFAVDAAGDRLARVVCGFMPNVAELLLYDRSITGYLRLPGLIAPHGLVWDGDELVVVSSGSNEVVRFSPVGERLSSWNPCTASGDAWHLNCLAFAGDGLYVSASGTSDHDLGWETNVAGGVLVRVGDAAPVISGLRRPHHPHWIDGSWLVCESAAGAVTRFAPNGTRLQTVDLGGWTRGLAADATDIYVGISCDRERPGPPRAEVVRLDRTTLVERDRAPVPAREIWDLRFVPSELVEGLSTGFVAGGAMALASRRPAAPIVSSDVPLAPTDVGVAIRIGATPGLVEAGQRLELDWTATNTGQRPLSPLGAFPFRIGVRWSTADELLADQHRVVLPEVLTPGSECSGRTVITVPPEAEGELTLTVSLVQELCWWLCDPVPAHGVRRTLSAA